MAGPKAVPVAIILLSIFLSPVFVMAGGPARGDDKVLARINNYTLTIADFESETKGKLPGGLSAADLEKAKESLLDDLITKKLLIQEAQKQNFDKDKAFIKEIEKYWEQALLKLLYKKRSQELLREISKDESDPEVRDRRVREALNAWIEDLKNSANIKKYKENLK
ncbi:MAG: SurA N-terminal domain-containing protein [Candidatus Omnitrophica bacterium]|nr:SurA N-terminal domain-containing protein [Candidatus Omnitrophota bacterium]